MANVIAFANQKGGVAKTTTTLNLGVALRELGHRVLVIDLDPQGNLTMSQGMNPDAIERSMFDVLVHRVPTPSPSPSRKSSKLSSTSLRASMRFPLPQAFPRLSPRRPRTLRAR